MAHRPPTTFGVLLRRHRTAALLTQEQLALRAQLSPDTIRSLERGKRRFPRPDSLHLLVEALSLSGAERAAFLAAARDDVPPVLASVRSQPNALIGRDDELETIRRRLTGAGDGEAGSARLLTLTGPAGVGKTRLALAATALVAPYYRDGVVQVDLTPIRDPALVLETVARAMGVSDGDSPLEARLGEYLRERSHLLLLDNFEQVLPAAGALAELLARCPGLTLLVTSRVPLRLRWEWTLRVPPLPAPDVAAPLPPLDALGQIPAVALFVERARARCADFDLNDANAPLVARLAAELDGLPLALELAAARLDALPLPVLARRLGDRLRLLHWDAADLPERQRSLEAAVGWSYDFLGEPERRLFRCLGVFVGHVSPPAVAAVLAATSGDATAGAGEVGAPDEGRALEGLASLAEKSLVLVAPPHGRDERDERDGFDGQRTTAGMDGPPEDAEDAEPSFGMLETVREYAWEQLDRLGMLPAARRAHARYFLTLAERADPHLRAQDQLPWYFHLEREHNNLRAALRWLLDAGREEGHSEQAAGLRLAGALSWFWWTRGYIEEGARWLDEALVRTPDADPALRARALRSAGTMLAYRGAVNRAATLLDEALTLAQRCQDRAEVAQAFAYCGLCAVYAGDAATGIPLLREGLRRGRDLGDPHAVAMMLLFLGAAALACGDDGQAEAAYAEALACFEAAGDGLFAVNLRLNLGWFAWRRGELAHAASSVRAALEMGVRSGNRRLLSFGAQMALSLPGNRGAGMPSADLADLAERARLLGAIDALNQSTGMTLMQTVLRVSMGELREQVRRAGLEAAYRAGRSLPFRAIAVLALALLDGLPLSLSSTGNTAEPLVEAAQGLRGPLSERQRQVLWLVAQGLSDKAIGRRLSLSASTVRYHLAAAFDTLGVGTRAQAVALATQHGLL